MSRRGSRGGGRRRGGGARGGSNAQRSQRGGAVADDGSGWNVKSSRQQKKNKLKGSRPQTNNKVTKATKPGNQQNGASKPKAKRNRRRNNKPNINSIVSQMAKENRYSPFGREDLKAVAEELALTSYDPNDTDLVYRVLNALQRQSERQVIDHVDGDHEDEDRDRDARDRSASQRDSRGDSPVHSSNVKYQNGSKSKSVSKAVSGSGSSKKSRNGMTSMSTSRNGSGAGTKGNQRDKHQHREQQFEDKEEESSDYSDSDDVDEEEDEDHDDESNEEEESEYTDETGSETVSDNDEISESEYEEDSDSEYDDDDDEDHYDESEDADDATESDDHDDGTDDAEDEKEESPPPRQREPEPEPEPSDDGDDKRSTSDAPQRSKRKKRRRRKKNKSTTAEQQNGDVDRNREEAANSPSADRTDNPSGNTSGTTSRMTSQATSEATSPTAEKGRKRNRKKKSSLPQKLRELDFTEAQSESLLSTWVMTLEKEKQRGAAQFLSLFQRAEGIEQIVKKVVLQFCKLDMSKGKAGERIYNLILKLFDLMLCGNKSYHEWLLNELFNLSGQIEKQNTNTDSNLVRIISEQAQSLVRAQCSSANRNSQNEPDRDEFQKPSALLHDGHRKPDPIIPVLEKLDPELETLGNLYHRLKVFDSEIRSSCPTHSESFKMEHSQIKDTLTQSISFNSNLQRQKESELDRMKRNKKMLDNDQNHKKIPLEQRLRNQMDQKMRFLDEKRRIEEDLRRIDENLQKTEMLIAKTEQGLQEVDDEFKPKMEQLETDIYDREFEIADYARESDCYSALLRTVDKSYYKLDEWTRMQMDSNSSNRGGLERDYIDHFVHYIKRMCDAKVQLRDRLHHIKETKRQYIQSDKQAQIHYKRSFNIEAHIKQCEKMILSDEDLEKNLENAIFEAIDKAQKMVSPELFNNFIRQISMDQAGECINLARYKTQRPMNSVGVGRMPRSTASTQTRMAPMQVQQGRARPAPPPRGRMHSQQMGGQRAPQQVGVQSVNSVQVQSVGVGVGQQHQGQQQAPQQQQQHAAPHRAPRTGSVAHRQPLSRGGQPQRSMQSQRTGSGGQQTMNGTVSRQNVHSAPSQMAMAGRKPPMTSKASQNGQSQQMMQSMMNMNGAPPHRRATGPMKAPVTSRQHNTHYNQQAAPSQNSQQAQGQQQPPQQQQVQRRRGPMPSNQTNFQQQYNQY